jgi:hypothetical protein
LPTIFISVEILIAEFNIILKLANMEIQNSSSYNSFNFHNYSHSSPISSSNSNNITSTNSIITLINSTTTKAAPLLEEPPVEGNKKFIKFPIKREILCFDITSFFRIILAWCFDLLLFYRSIEDDPQARKVLAGTFSFCISFFDLKGKNEESPLWVISIRNGIRIYVEIG